jgi:DNA-binding transcriptional MerR regulator
MPRTTRKNEGMCKISDLARETGVPIGTIKFYMREGLLPPPTLKTGRNMAYYDRRFVDRIRAIKELKQKRFLPLEVIKAILERDSDVISSREVDTLLGLEGRFYEEIHYPPGREPIAREDVRTRYAVEPDLLTYFVDSGILTPVRRCGEECFEGDDIAILETLAEMRRAGFEDDLIPKEVCVPLYVDAIGKLAREELLMFSRAVTGKMPPARVAELAITGTKLIEQLMILLRRKLLLRALQDLRIEMEAEPTGTDD